MLVGRERRVYNFEFDDIGDAVHESEAALLVNAPKISGVKPAILIQDLPCGTQIFVVGLEDIWSADANFSPGKWLICGKVSIFYTRKKGRK